MTSAEYRARAEKLLTTYTVGGSLAPGAVEQATVWAQLAHVTAITEQAQVPAGETAPQD